MTELHLPLLELTILIPLVGAAIVSRLRDPSGARHWAVGFTAAALVVSLAAWQDFQLLHVTQADDRWHLMTRLLGGELFSVDQLSAPLLPLAALLYFLTTVTTMKTKIRRFSFAWTLLSEANLLAMLSCREPWPLITFMGLGTVLPYLELRARHKPTRVYVFHMALYIGLSVLGETFVVREGPNTLHSLWALLPLLAAVFIRSGIAPLHCWMPSLFENATFGTALLFTTPLVGAYAAVRLVLPIAEESVLRNINLIALATSVYTAAMSLIQRDARRFFCYLFLSHSSLVLVGLDVVTPIGLTGALCVWLSAALSLGGFGLTLRALESRHGNLSLTEFQGLYDHMPTLAVCFFLTGLAAVGFPGTMGFIGTEMLIDGAVEIYPYTGVAVVIASALNGIAFVRAYFLLFTGTRHVSPVSLGIGLRERLAVLALAALIVIGGIFPRYRVNTRFAAAEELLRQRPATLNDDHSDEDHAHAEALEMHAGEESDHAPGEHP